MVAGEQIRKLTFEITGEFITQITREWFYSGEKSMEEIMEILKNSMTGTDTPEARIKIRRRHSAWTSRTERQYSRWYVSPGKI